MIDPFMGSAVVFFAMKPSCAVISDKHEYLMDLFLCLKEQPETLIRHVSQLCKDHQLAAYEKVKAEILTTADQCKRAAMYYYLIKTSLFSYACMKSDKSGFICCYRKRKGEDVEQPRALPLDESVFWDYHNALNRPEVTLQSVDFEETLQTANEGDFVFLDPPYMCQTRPSRKIYSAFTPDDHKRLIKAILELDQRKCYVMMFNHTHPDLEKALGHFRKQIVPHQSFRRTGQFSNFEEVIYTNY